MKTLLSLVLLTLAATVQAYGVDDNLGTVTNGTNDAFTLENSPPGLHPVG